jgi:hypothetical protein
MSVQAASPQREAGSPIEPDSIEVTPPEVQYVLDGQNTSFAWGRQLAPTKIAVGLTDEGVYELRGDSAIWFVDYPDREDMPLCNIATDPVSGNIFFLLDRPQGPVRIIYDTLGITNHDGSLLMDKTGKPMAKLNANEHLESMTGIPYLLTAPTLDRKLLAFFLWYHYLPRKK